MIEIYMTQDITKHKSKFIGGFTTRQIICLFFAAITSLLAYFSLDMLQGRARLWTAAALSLPFLLVGFVTIYEQPFEKIVVTMARENLLFPLNRKKEVHFDFLEKYEKSEDDEEAEPEESSNKKKKKKTKKAQPHGSDKKIRVPASSEYRAIK